MSFAAAERTRVVVALAVASLLYPAFGLLDWVVYPEHLGEFLRVRFLVAGFFVLLILFARRSRTVAPLVLIGACGVLAATAGITIMIHLAEGHASLYYAGLCVALVFTAVLFTWPLWVGILVTALVLFGYYLPMLWEPGPLDGRLLAANGFFLLSTAGVSLLGAHLRNRLALAEFRNRSALSEKNAELEQLHRTKDRMFQNVSHELRTPLTMMLVSLELLAERGEVSPQTAAKLEAMTRNGLRLLHLINDLLQVARLAERQVPSRPVPMNVTAFVATLIDDATEMAAAKQVALSFAAPAAAVHYRLDPEHMEHILLNLLSNAFKFTRRGGAIEVAVGGGEAGLEIAVIDDGIGMSPAALHKVFERFHQADDGTTRRYGGTGIGLSLVRELTQLLGGTVEVHSVEGEGTRFTLRFPPALRCEPGAVGETPADARDEDAASLTRLSRRAAYEALRQGTGTLPRVTIGSTGPRVLVAEDDLDLNQQIVEVLSARCRVRTVADGRAALDAAVHDIPHLIVSDVMMPEMSGLELAAAVRERPALRDTPIVLLSARGELEDRIRGRELGIDAYLTKPFHPRELLATVEGLLRSRMKLVGRFLVHERLGAGGQAEVYLAEHIDTGQPVALKLLSALGDDRDAALLRLQREKDRLAKIEHPNVVRIVEQGQQDQRYYLAMEFLDGSTVREIVNLNGALAPATVQVVATALCAGLDAIHAAGLLHRDVKCENIMILRGPGPLGPRVRLIDFGAILDEAIEKEDGHVLIGTVPYMAPEILRGGAPTAASEVYAIGVSMFVMATGKLPDAGDDSRQIPEPLGRLIARAMATDPGERFQTVAELRASLAADEPGETSFRMPPVRSGVSRVTPTLG